MENLKMQVMTELHYTHNYWIILLPAIMAAGDVVTGFIQAQINGTKRSSTMRKGLYRKLGELGAIVLTFVTCVALALPVSVAAAASLYVVFMEALSILENLKAAGIPIPDFITKKGEEIHDQINSGAILEHHKTDVKPE